MHRNVIYLLCGFLFAASAPASVIHVISEQGQLTGARNVSVEGELYDVDFIDGTCIEVFDGCDDLDGVVFWGSSAGRAASAALLEQVFVDLGTDPAFAFDRFPSLTLGCESGRTCDVMTRSLMSLGSSFATIATQLARNRADGLLLDDIAGPDNQNWSDSWSTAEPSRHPSDPTERVWAKWSLVAAAPTSSPLILLVPGLFAVWMARRQRQLMR